VQVRTRTATVAGTAEGSDAWGRLLVRDAAGKLHAIAAGDVSLRR
jgi:biotin-(acetyl-CoA carboxylase) ligase